MKTVHAIIVCTGLTLASCTGTRNSTGWTTTAQSSPQRLEKDLHQRALRFWTAKAAEDWNTVFDYQYEPDMRARLVKEEFADWSSKNDPLKVQNFSLGRLSIDGDLGWVEVEYRSTVRRYPDFEPREARLWQKWRHSKDGWFPIPQEDLDSYPESPVLRDAVLEQGLRERFDQTFQARLVRDWKRLYDMTDPRDRETVTFDMYVEAEELFEYLSCQVEWVEVIKEFGRVRVNYRHKVTDKSLEKLGAKDGILTERWVLIDNQWYRDLKRR